MKRLKSSRLVKTICFLLCILFTAGVTANIILGLLLQESNVFYAEKDQLNEILLEDVIEHYNQTDITNYLRETIMNPGPATLKLKSIGTNSAKATPTFPSPSQMKPETHYFTTILPSTRD